MKAKQKLIIAIFIKIDLVLKSELYSHCFKVM
jgi:hypothetical protein